MSVDITIVPPKGWPDPMEPILSFARCPGNLLTAPEELGLPRLDKITSSVRVCTILITLIEEIDKKESVFDFNYWRECGMVWDDGKAMIKQLYKYRKFEGELSDTPEEMWAEDMRQELRRVVFRFLSYFMMGYEVKWSY